MGTGWKARRDYAVAKRNENAESREEVRKIRAAHYARMNAQREGREVPVDPVEPIEPVVDPDKQIDVTASDIVDPGVQTAGENGNQDDTGQQNTDPGAENTGSGDGNTNSGPDFMVSGSSTPISAADLKIVHKGGGRWVVERKGDVIAGPFAKDKGGKEAAQQAYDALVAPVGD